MKKNDCVRIKSWGKTSSNANGKSIHLHDVTFPKEYSRHYVNCLSNNPTNKWEIYEWDYDYSLEWRIYAIGLSKIKKRGTTVCLINHKLKHYTETVATNIIKANKPIKLYKYILNTN